MTLRVRSLFAAALAVVIAGTSVPIRAQPAASAPAPHDIHRAVIVPPSRPLPGMPVVVRSAGATIDIVDHLATTALEFELFNSTHGPLETQLLIPVPDNVTIRSFQYDGTGPEPTAKLLPRDEARSIYESIVRRTKDPGLLEFVGASAIRTSVFPVPPHTAQKVRITYEQVLTPSGGRVDYVLPRSESLTSSGVPWTIRGRISGTRPIATVYCPSHAVSVTSVSATESTFTLTPEAAAAPGWLRLSCLLRQDAEQPAASLIAYPDAAASSPGGYFMLLLAAPPRSPDAPAITREVTLVLDRSGSMRGEKFEQARQAAISIVESLAEGELFNIVDYSDSISSFAPAPVARSRDTAEKARAYLLALSPGGGTNLHDALLEALRPAPAQGVLPLVLFLTDGLPTVGVTDEKTIREAVAKANAHRRRVFTFGVGYDVNSPLLTAVASGSRAATTFVLPGENVESKVSDAYRRLTAPILTSPTLTAVDEQGNPLSGVILDLQPAVLPDFFDGEQVVVLGRYTGSGGSLRLRLDAHAGATPRSAGYTFDLSAASPRHAFVPRLWATRRVGALIEAVRQLGVSGPDPRTKELIDEIVTLSQRWGIMTEYTSFLATDPDDRTAVAPPPAAAAPMMAEKSMSFRNTARAGAAAVNQDANSNTLMSSSVAFGRPAYFDKQMQRVEVRGVQMANDQTLIRRGPPWVDARLLANESDPPEQTVEFGTDEYFQVLRSLERDGLQSLLINAGDLYLLVNGRRTLVRNPA